MRVRFDEILQAQKIFFLFTDGITAFLFDSDRQGELLMVGPPAHERKVLRDTDGERFVVKKKDAVFKENLEVAKKKIDAKGYI